MYDFLDKQLKEYYEVVTVFRSEGEKYLARIRHKESGQDFVVRRFTGSAGCYQKLLTVQSRYLPKILEAAEKDGQVLVLEEYIAGDSVYDMLSETVFSKKEVRLITLDVCRALYILHQNGIVHRDVKPENILLRDSHAVLLDFDAARLVKGEQTCDTQVLGTTGYAAPEQYGLSQTDARADIYALGVTMNLMLTGTHPSIRLAPGRLGRIITRCTMVQPDQRFDNVEKLMEVLA